MLSKGPGFVPQPPEPKGNPQTTDPQLTTQAPSKTPPITPPLSPVTLDFPSGNDEPPLPHFGRYELLEKLGGGGMGLVFRAVDTQLHRQVALKTIREGVFADGQEIGRFLNEAHAIAKLHHPNIISIYDIGKEQGHHFFTMQLASGGTLSQHLDDFAHSEPKRAVALMEKIARAVQCAHERQILHRDLKPANILLDENGEPLVSDFGLVKFLDQDQELTRAGKAMGTRPYMSPEQLTGLKENMSPASDIWSLGVILYELLTERRPFVSPSDEELSNLIKSADPPSPRQHRRQLDRDLETIVFKCLRKNPAQRYATAQQLADDLKCWLEQRPIHARPLSWPERFGRRLRSKLTWAIGGAALVFFFAGYFLFFKQSEADQWVRDIPKQLKAGKAVTLIGPTGGPKWSRWARPTDTALPKGEKGKPFRMAGFDLMLLELVPDPGVASYRFRAEVKHIDGQVPYRVGLYFSQTKQATTEDDANLFLELTYTDMNIENPTTGNNIVRVLADLVREPGPGVIINFFSGTALFFKHSPDLKKPWRQLAVEATQEGYQVFWENQLVEKLSWTELNETGKAGLDGTIDFGNAVNPSLNALRTVNPAYGPLQGLGLYCNESVAEFRNVILEPIPSKQP